jgi:hypothetical protein
MPMSYTQLVADKDTAGSIKYFVRHSEVPSDFILERAQDAIFQLLRVREMITRFNGTITTGSSSVALPTDMLEPQSILLAGAYKNKIIVLDQEHFESRVGEDDTNAVYDGIPTFCTYDATTLYFDAKADQNYPYRIWYMAKPALLAAGNQTNFLTTRYGNILEAMCKHYAYEHRENDSKASVELEKATAFISKANEEYDMFRQSIQTELYWSP